MTSVMPHPGSPSKSVILSEAGRGFSRPAQSKDLRLLLPLSLPLRLSLPLPLSFFLSFP
jgi:hypothetical protein